MGSSWQFAGAISLFAWSGNLAAAGTGSLLTGTPDWPSMLSRVADCAFGVSAVYFLRALYRLRLSYLIRAERMRLARDLHDAIQGFVGVAIQIETVRRGQLPPAPEWGPMLTKATDQLDQSLRDVRLVITRERLSALDDSSLSLPEAITALGSEITENHLVETKVHGTIQKLPREVEMGIHSCAREAAINAVRHAQATKIYVTLSYLPDGWQLAVEDDGQGIRPEAVASRGHWGFRGLRERADLLKARLQIDSRCGEGTRILLTQRRESWWKNRCSLKPSDAAASASKP